MITKKRKRDKSPIKLDRVFPIRKFIVLELLFENQALTYSELAQKMNIERSAAYACLYHYKKQGLIEKVEDYWILTKSGINRYAFLKARKKLEGESLRLPGMKKKEIAWQELQEKDKEKEREELEELKRKVILLTKKG